MARMMIVEGREIMRSLTAAETQLLDAGRE